MAKTDYKTIDEYIATFSPEDQIVLQKIRRTIKKAVPEAEEVISYQMPTFKYHGYLIYFAAFAHHYSLFIPPRGVLEKFQRELKPYYTHKATIQFQKSEPIPYDLITKLAQFSAEVNRHNDKK